MSRAAGGGVFFKSLCQRWVYENSSEKIGFSSDFQVRGLNLNRSILLKFKEF